VDSLADNKPKKRDWRDSNLYIGFISFWKEFRRHRIGIIGIVILAGFSLMAITAPALATHDPAPNNKVAPSYLAPGWMSIFDPGGVVSDNYLENPDFLESPDFTVRGTNSDEFNYLYHSGTGEDDFSHVNLTWTHDQEPMDYPLLPDPTGNMPDSSDFVYFTQSFIWPFEQMPSDVNVTMDFATTLTGDFLNEEATLMFKIYIWLIDSSGNWRQIYTSYPPYLPVYQTRSADLNWYDIIEGFRGMVEVDGEQDDPTDELTLGIGLAPTFAFRNFGGATPELNYTGSVTVSFKSSSMFVYGNYFGYLGTTDKGADAWSQIIYGSRVSLMIGILATALSTVVGVIVGMTAGYFGGKSDEILMRIVDFLLVIPGLPLMMVLAAFLGPTIDNIIIVISILGWTGTSRLIRSQVMAEKNKAYVESARAIGASDTYIIYRHILPNVTPILFADITLGVVGAILSESGLAFLGLTDPSEPSWGRMLADAQASGGFLEGAWWVVVFPGLMITVISLAFTFVGHTLDQVLNPRLRER
jgi:ABC-type dipeptide/oligopeptide/nickel transport system permease subunit